MKLKGLLAAAAALAISAGATMVQAKDHIKIGFVYVGPLGDLGWNYQHDLGRLAIEEALGDKVETSYVENVSEGPDAERVITQMARSGTDLIFTTSFGFMDQTMKVAKMFPSVRFEHATGYKRAHNVSTYAGRFYEGRAVIGHIAGHMTKTNTIGYIASFPIPEVVRGINAAYLAAKAVNPDVKMKIVWVSTWFDPAKEADAANALVEQGADVVMQHTDSTAPMAALKDKGIVMFGQASDMGEFKPAPRVTAIIDNWGPYYVARAKAVLDGSWESTDTWNGLATGLTQIGEMTEAVPEDVRASAQALADAIAAGTVHPFTGPINKQDGSVWLKEGETADDGTLLGMNFYVEGIEGDLPH